MECHVINLDRSINNFYKIRPSLIRAGLSPQRFKGVDAKKGHHKEHLYRLTNNCKKFCPSGVIGCGLSHILLAEQLLYNGYGTQGSLILEDDVTPINESTLLNDIQSTIESVPQDWDIIKLHCDMCIDGTNSHNINGGSFAAYLISKSGLEKMASLKLDWHIDLQANNTFKIYKSSQNLFKADESFSDHSDRNVVTPFGLLNGPKKYFFSGEKNFDDMISYKVFKIFNYEVSGLQLILFCILCTIFLHKML
jgi:GR25 family glycosyltransferase involved in LPS biosynthesis